MKQESLYDIPDGCICLGDGLYGMKCNAATHATLKQLPMTEAHESSAGLVKRYRWTWREGRYLVSEPCVGDCTMVMEKDCLDLEARLVRAEAENARLRTALERVEKYAIYGCGTKHKDIRGKQFGAIVDICRAALKGEQKSE